MTTGNGNEPNVPLISSVLGAAKASSAVEVPSLSFRGGTVVSYTETPPALVVVRPDTAGASLTNAEGTSEIPCRSLLNRPLYPGTRVMLLYQEGAATVIGIIGIAPLPGIALYSTSNQVLNDATPTTVTYTNTAWSACGMTQVSGNVRAPYAGIYSSSGTVFWDQIGLAPALRDAWLRIEHLDVAGALISSIAWSMDSSQDTTYWFQADSVANAGWPLRTGEQLRLRANHDTGGAATRTILNTSSPAIFTVQWVGPADLD